MINILHRLDNPVKNCLREDIDLRRREDIGRLLLHLLQDRPLRIHIRKARNRRGQNTLIKGEEDHRRPMTKVFINDLSYLFLPAVLGNLCILLLLSLKMR